MSSPGPILIVDDEPHVRRFLGLVLRGLGLGELDVHEFADGASALAQLPDIRPAPALILLDINLPGIDGIETLRRLRATGLDCPVVMITSQATRQMAEDAIAAGANHFIRKDTEREEIAATLARLLSQPGALPVIPPDPSRPHGEAAGTARPAGAHDFSLSPAPMVRFSLQEMLTELERDHASGSFSTEKLNQKEILNLFETRRRRREKKA